MKRLKDRSPTHQVRIKFRKGLDNLDELRSGLSTCVICDRNLLLACDESSAIERLTWKNGKYKKHKTFELDEFFELPDGPEGEMDIEGLAWEQPWLWVSGSMSVKRDSPDDDDDDDGAARALAKIKVDRNRFTLGKIPCKKDENSGTWTPVKSLAGEDGSRQPLMLEGGPDSTVLTELLARDEHLGPFMDIPCKDNGFDIEGLAVNESRVFLGLRGPVLGGWAVVLEIAVHEHDGWLLLDSRGSSAKPYRKHFVNLAGMGIRELNVENGDMYLLAGPTMDLDGTISAWRVKACFPQQPVSFTRKPHRLFDIVYGSMNEYGRDKAEGMAVTADGDFLVIYDSPLEERLKKKRSVLADVFSGAGG